MNIFGGVIEIDRSLQGTMKLPYCNSPHALSITLRGSTGFAVSAAWSGGAECISFTESLTFETCGVASETYVNDGGSAGMDSWTRTSTTEAEISAKDPVIPTASRVASKQVLTRSDLTVTVTMDGEPASDLPVSLESDRGATDTITGPSAPTDAAGMATAQVETRLLPGPSTITVTGSDVTTTSPAVIEWLPAKYESSFLVTCYVISAESDFAATPLIGPVNGLPPRHRQGFINDVRLQGSGMAQNGTIIHYDGRNRYSVQSCALTATGVCAVDGSTAAVDRAVVPLRSSISINSVGARDADDTGGAITGYHIDEYFGTRRAECIRPGRRQLEVEFLNY